MSVSVVGMVFAVLGIIAIFGTGKWFVWLLSASSAFVTTAAITFAGNSLPPFYILAVLAAGAAFVRWARGAHVHHRAVVPLILFVAWSLVITALGPTLFSGIAILDPRSGIDDQIYSPTPLTYTPSMFAQAGYLILGAGVVWYLGQTKNLSPGVLTPAFLTGTLLSLVRLIPGMAEPSDSLFRNYASAWFNPWESRHVGIFSEPSYLAVFATTALAYSLYRIPRTVGNSRLAAFVIAVSATVNLLLSYSGTAALALIVLVAMAVAVYGFRFFFLRMKLRPAALLIPAGLIFLLLIPNPATEALWGTIDEKSESNSFLHRTASDMFSIDLTWATYGLGVGLGANRPSSMLTLVLSSVGVLGVILLAVVVVRAVRPLWRVTEWVPTAVALIALLVTKTISEPALSTPVLWLCIGAAVSAAAGDAREGAPPAGQARRSRAQPKRELAAPPT